MAAAWSSRLSPRAASSRTASAIPRIPSRSWAGSSSLIWARRTRSPSCPATRRWFARMGITKTQAWFTPVDDTNTMRINVSWAPDPKLLRPITDQMVPGQMVAGSGSSYGAFERPVTKDYYRDYYNVDTIHGIPMNHFRAQDIMVNESQGDICDRTKESLGQQDVILNLMRQMMFQSIKDVQQGKDPKHIIRDPEENDIYYVRGPEPAEHI